MERRGLVLASLSLMLSISLFLGSSGIASAASVPGADVTYTTDADFNKGMLVNLNHDDPNNNQLQLNEITSTFPFIWIALSGRGTIAKVDTVTGKILGEYLSAPDGRGRNPSRTTVDLNGNVWAANRAESSGGKGSAVHIGLNENNQCIDRNGNGVIETSTGLGDVRPWSNPGGADDNGGVSSAEDECIIHYTRVAGTGTRTIAVDANNDVWVGGRNDREHEKISGITGLPIAGTLFNFGCGGYGGLIDGNGVLWSAKTLLRYDPSSNIGTCIYLGTISYGLGIDGAGNIWNSTGGDSSIHKISPEGKVLSTYPLPSGDYRGMAVTPVNQNVWVANYYGDEVLRLTNDGVLVTSIPVGRAPTGVAVDAAGKVWVTNRYSHNAMRIDPATNQVDLTVYLGSGADPYNYSDMTGTVAIGTTSPQGTWTITQDSGILKNIWGTIRWNTEPEGSEPDGTVIIVEARVADTEAGLGGQNYIVVSNGLPFAIEGRYIQVRVTLKPDAAGNSPVLSDIRICQAPINNVRIIDTISTANIDLDSTSFSHEPFSITTEGDQTVIEWRFGGFSIGQIEDLSFDVILKNPVSGEDRLVNHKLEVLYTDEDGNPVRTELGPQYVHILESVVNINVSTDKPEYQANENAGITVVVKNDGTTLWSGTGEVYIEDPSGNQAAHVATFDINDLKPLPEPPFLEGWSNRIPLIVEHTKIDEDLTDFPVRIHLSSTSGINSTDVSNIFDELGGTRKKIAITASDGITQSYVEIEKWDEVNKEAELWVKIPSINSTEDTTLYLYYDSNQTDNTGYIGDTAENVWDSNYKAVWHMSQDPSMTAPQILDSTINANYGTSHGLMTSSDLVDGQVAKAIDFDGVNDYIEVGNSVSLNPGVITIEIWAKSNTPTWNNTGFLVSKRNVYILHPKKGTKDITFYIWTDSGWRTVLFSDPDIDITKWHHYVGTYDGSTLRIYVDGILKNSNAYTYTWSIYRGDTGSLFIGWDDGFAGRFFNGLIDEVSISDTARSPAWIKASYYSQSDNLINFGSAESIDDIDPSSIRTYAFTWNTGITLSGNYLVRAELYENGIFLTEDTANFTILPEKTVTSKVTTDKMEYNANQTVTINSTIQSTSPNYIFENLNARITITDINGTELYTETNTIPILTPDQLTEFKTYWNTSQNPKGTYTVTLEILEGTTTLSTSTTTFEILGTSDTGEGLTGTITASPDPVYQGKDETITYTITNNGNEDIDNLNVKVLIVDPDEEEIKTEFSSQYSVNSGETITEIRTVSTVNLTPKTYLAILQASTSSMPEPKTLASTTLEVKPGIEITKTIPDVTNLLVWVNEKCVKDSSQESGVRSQDKNKGKCRDEEYLRLDLLEGILGEAVTSYHIVYDKKDFQTELRNPYYTDFLIIGNHHPLEDNFYKELREQVYSGKGLISILRVKHGEHHREDYDPLFGIRFKGYLSGDEHEIELLDSPISETGTLEAKGKAVKVEAMQGTIVAGWISKTERRGKCCQEDEQTKYPAIVLNEYGNGRTIYYAFDLGLTLNDENYDQLSDLINNSINYVHKPIDTITFYPYQLIPVEITIKSLGAAFDLRITETYPAEIKLYDPSTELRTGPSSKQWITESPWLMDIHLEPDETKTILYYALTPDQAGTYTLQTEIEYLEGGDYKFYQSLNSDIIVNKDTATITDNIITALNALSVAEKDRGKLDNVIGYIENVQNRAIASEQDLDKNIQDILKAIDSLLSITSADTSDVRLMIDEILRIWEGRYYFGLF